MSESRPPTSTGAPRGATPIGAGGSGGRKKGLLLGTLLLVALIALLLLLSQCGGDDDDSEGNAADSTSESTQSSSSPSSTGSGSGSSTSGSPSAGAGDAEAGQPGSVVAGGQSVLPLATAADPAAALAAVTGQQATGTAVQVLSVPADEGFWVGTSDTDRVWVQLTGEAGESPYQVQEGDTVDFEGTVVAHDAGFAGQVGVDPAEGADQLTQQAQHIEVAKSAVRLSA
ncbi:hypothetical protein [Blastococcus sp. TF02A-26]|uniref:hypothetical protein n=1 Tax=Blastococcus sp. TF02A-26 TaxID=2250577 RepID=UPI000DEAE4F2|nr:hypothetical protein [Blastococcus sp. TF02A-26]RBY88280.1 hypothetical protein DQ240_05465 [Blastococcus sp. TF02A-26]